MTWAQYDVSTGYVTATTRDRVDELPDGLGQTEVPGDMRVDHIRVNLSSGEVEVYLPPENTQYEEGE